MKKRSVGALFAGILLGALSAFVSGFVGISVLCGGGRGLVGYP